MDTASIFLFKNNHKTTLACCGVTHSTLLQAKLLLFLLQCTYEEDSTILQHTKHNIVYLWLASMALWVQVGTCWTAKGQLDVAVARPLFLSLYRHLADFQNMSLWKTHSYDNFMVCKTQSSTGHTSWFTYFLHYSVTFLCNQMYNFPANTRWARFIQKLYTTSPTTTELT